MSGAASQWEGAKTQRQQSISIGKASTTWKHCPAQMPRLQCGLKAKGMGQSFLELFWSQVTTQFPALFLFVCLFVSESWIWGFPGIGLHASWFYKAGRWEVLNFGHFKMTILPQCHLMWGEEMVWCRGNETLPCTDHCFLNPKNSLNAPCPCPHYCF